MSTITARHRVAVTAVSLAVAGLALAGCHGKSAPGGDSSTVPAGSGGSTSSGPATVKVVNFSFTPQSITVQPGTKVTWDFEDSVDHNVDIDNGKIQSKDLHKGETYSYTFNKAGTYNYICSIHQYMTGKVIVK